MSVRRLDGSPRRFMMVHARRDAQGRYVGYVDAAPLTVATGNNGWAISGNCNAIHYTDAAGRDYLLHTAISGTDSQPQSGRSNLTVNYAQIGDIADDGEETYVLNHRSTTLQMTDGISLSDPLDARSESAQYSSIVEIEDHTVGVLFEEYPLGVMSKKEHNHGDANRQAGDFMLQSVFMRLRIGDIIESAEAPDVQPLPAPVITPGTQTYSITGLADAHPDVRIKREGSDGDGVMMEYTVQYTSPSGLITTVYGPVDTSDAQVWLHWSALAPKLAEALNISTPEPGSTLTVRARTYRMNHTALAAQSVQVYQVYSFADPVRRVVILAHNVTGATGYGEPQLQAASQTVGSGVPVTTGVGSKVSVLGADGGKYEFRGFTLADTFSDDNKLKYAQGGIYEFLQAGKQVRFALPAAADLADNYDTDGDGAPDALCVHVWYSYNGSAVGVISQTVSCYHGIDSWKGGRLQADKFQSASWASTAPSVPEDVRCTIRTDAGFETEVPQRDLASDAPLFPASAGSTHAAAPEMRLPFNLCASGAPLDLCVSVLPDAATAREFNAVIMLAVEKNAKATGITTDASTHTYLRDENGRLVYALLQGQLHPVTDPAFIEGASGRVYDWYGVWGSQSYPALGSDGAVAADFAANMPHDTFRRTDNSGDMAFQGVHFVDVQELDGFAENFTSLRDVLYAVVYVVPGTITDAEQLARSTAQRSGDSPAIYTLYHPMALDPNGGMTGVQECREPLAGDCGEVRWYDITGRRLSGPVPGSVCIRRQGSVATKRIEPF